MARQAINRGTTAGDGTGESLFSAFGKTNDNFSELYGVLYASDGVTPLWFFDAIDPRSHGCKGDGQLVLDANLTLVSGTTYNVASATANGGAGFVANDVGKIIAVMNRATTSASDTARSATISAIVGNQAQITFGNVPGGTLTGMRCVFGTDDTANMQATLAIAGQQQRPVVIAAIYTIANLTSLPDDVTVFGLGPDQKRIAPQNAPYYGGAISCAKWPGAGKSMIVAGLGNGFYNLTLDGFGNCDAYTLDTSANLGKAAISKCMILSGYNANVLVGPTVNITDSSLWMHRGGLSHNVVISGGDNRLSNCDIAGSGNNQYQIRITAAEVQLNSCHSWKNSELVASGRANGGQILIQPANNNCYGIEINDHIHDTSVGAFSHVAIDLSNITNAYDISLNGGRVFQAASSGHMPIAKLTIPAGKALRGFTVRDIKGVADFAMSESSQYTYLVDGSGVAGNVYASATGGCNVMDCAALYNFSATWTAWDKNDGNMILPTYAGTVPTIG